MLCATCASLRAAHFNALRSAFRESCEVVFTETRKVKKMAESAVRHDVGYLSAWKCKGERICARGRLWTMFVSKGESPRQYTQ
jgi:hypothetical protein